MPTTKSALLAKMNDTKEGIGIVSPCSGMEKGVSWAEATSKSNKPIALAIVKLHKFEGTRQGVS